MGERREQNLMPSLSGDGTIFDEGFENGEYARSAAENSDLHGVVKTEFEKPCCVTR